MCVLDHLDFFGKGGLVRFFTYKVGSIFHSIIGVRDLVARGYVIPGGASQRGGVVGRPRSVSHVVRPRQGSGFEGLGWVPLGPKRARQGRVWSRMGPYISRTLIRDSRVIRQGPSGPVGSYRVPTGFRRNPVLAQWDPTWLDGSLGCPVLMHD